MLLTEIQNVKNQNLICLDFDECIIEWGLCRDKEIENCKDNLLQSLKKNVEIIYVFCKRKNYKNFIVSSWSRIIDDDLKLKDDCSKAMAKFIISAIKTNENNECPFCKEKEHSYGCVYLTAKLYIAIDEDK